MTDVTIRTMTFADIPAGNRLRELAGWNQTEKDWRRFLQLEPAGCFAACVGDKLCGTVTTLNYQNRFGWVGMVLVDPEYRRQTIGTRLLAIGIKYLEAAGVETVKLDATPMGHGLYIEQGFVDEYGIERWEGVSLLRNADCGMRNENKMRNTDCGMRIGSEMGNENEMQIADIERVCEKDRLIFGADRSRLLTSIWQENPSLSAVIYCNDEIAGYVLGRAGARAYYLGPWVATGAAVAEQLFQEFLARLPSEKIFVDVCMENRDARALVKAAGFQFQRPLTRMYRGFNNHPGQPQSICAIAGPELG